MELYLGVDIGGTKIAEAIVQRDGVVRKSRSCPTPVREGSSGILYAAIQLAKQLVSHEEEDIVAVGVGSGGQIDCDAGVVVSATDLLPGWTGTPLKKAFTNSLNRPVFVDNDVNALACGEALFGVAGGLDTVLFLAIGTGIGGALLLNGSLYHGAHWSGAEFGHILLSMDPGARRDSGGARGTFEAYASGLGLAATFDQLSPGRKPKATGEEIAAEALTHPEGPAAAAITLTGEYLGYGLATLANALDPSLIVIGGGMSVLGERLLTPARRILTEHALPGPGKAKLVTTTLGSHSSAIGAAALAMQG